MMRERGRETGENTKSLEGDWKEVTGTKRHRSFNRERQPIHKPTTVHVKRRDGRERGVSIFIDNLPIFYDRYLLRKLFFNQGRMLDSYIPTKRRVISNSRYGFICFEREQDALNAVKRMNGIVIFKHKITVALSRFAKGHVWKETKKTSSDRKDFDTKRRSYAEVVSSKGKVWKKKITTGFGGSSHANGKSPEEASEKFTTTGGLEDKGAHMEILGRIQALSDLQERQEKRLAELELWCINMKKEVEARKHETEVNFEKGSCCGEDTEVKENNKNEEDDHVCPSKVADSLEKDNGNELHENEEGSKSEDGSRGFEKEGEEYVELGDGLGSRNEEEDTKEAEYEGKGSSVDGLEEESVKTQRKKVRNSFSDLLAKPCSVRFKNLRANSGLSNFKRKKRVKTAHSAMLSKEDFSNTSLTESVVPEVGAEFINRQYRDIEALRLEAALTVEVGTRVGVTF